MFLRLIGVSGLLTAALWAQTVEGVVLDCTGAAVPGARVMLMDNYVLKTESVSGQRGEFVFKDVAPGLHQVLVKKDRFALFEQSFLAREERTTKLTPVLAPDRMRESVTIESKGTPNTDQTRLVRSGGKIEWMKMLRPARPRYPEKAAAAGIQGQVILFARGRTDGSLEVISVLSSPDSELEASARQAAAQVRYVPMTLNGEPTEWTTELTFDYRLKP